MQKMFFLFLTQISLFLSSVFTPIWSPPAVYTSNYPCHHVSFHTGSCAVLKILFNTFKLALTDIKLHCQNQRASASRTRGNVSDVPAGTLRKLCSPLTVSVPTSSVWIQSELNPWPFPLSLPSLLPSILLGTCWPLTSASPLRPARRPCAETLQGKRTQDQKLPPHC